MEASLANDATEEQAGLVVAHLTCYDPGGVELQGNLALRDGTDATGIFPITHPGLVGKFVDDENYRHLVWYPMIELAIRLGANGAAVGSHDDCHGFKGDRAKHIEYTQRALEILAIDFPALARLIGYHGVLPDGIRRKMRIAGVEVDGFDIKYVADSASKLPIWKP